MRNEARLIFKLMSPRIIAKALTMLDKSTAIVVGVCWIVAIVTLGIAVYSVHSAVASKRQASDAVVAEPILPRATPSPLNPRDGQMVLERLQHQFPDIKFDINTNQDITAISGDGTKFHQWITALGFIDTMAPQYRWSLLEFCVGHCGQDLMKAVVIGQKVTFSLPQDQ